MSNSKTNKKVAIYVRVGRPEQLIDSKSLPNEISSDISLIRKLTYKTAYSFNKQN